MEENKVVFGADRVKVYGPKVTDNSYTVTIETGEYAQMDVAKIMMLPKNSMLRVTIEVMGSHKKDTF